MGLFYMQKYPRAQHTLPNNVEGEEIVRYSFEKRRA